MLYQEKSLVHSEEFIVKYYLNEYLNTLYSSSGCKCVSCTFDRIKTSLPRGPVIVIIVSDLFEGGKHFNVALEYISTVIALLELSSFTQQPLELQKKLQLTYFTCNIRVHAYRQDSAKCFTMNTTQINLKLCFTNSVLCEKTALFVKRSIPV